MGTQEQIINSCVASSTGAIQYIFILVFFIYASCGHREKTLRQRNYMKHLTPYRQNETFLSPMRGRGMVYEDGMIKEFA